MSRPRMVERAAERPDLAVQLARSAQLKLVSRKSNFGIGEMITLDIALLNTSSTTLYFRQLSDLDIKITGSAGQPVAIQKYGVVDKAMVPHAFVRIRPGEITVHSIHLLAGCDKRAFAQTAIDDDQAVFDTGSFVNWGNACLPLTKPEKLVLSVEMINDHVRLPNIGKIATAVGRISSNSLDLSIVD